jgi:anaerobic selenocysteine-containing dehydrogenase
MDSPSSPHAAAGGRSRFPARVDCRRTALVHRTIFRDPAWRKRDAAGALPVSAANAEAIGLAEGDQAVVTTKRGSARVVVEIRAMMRAGHIGLGVIHEQGKAPVGARPTSSRPANTATRSLAPRTTSTYRHGSRQSRHEPGAL